MTKGNEPAFAKSAFYHPQFGIFRSQEGLTKREYFAALAMQGFTSDNKIGIHEIADLSVKIADALIEKLNNKQQ